MSSGVDGEKLLKLSPWFVGCSLKVIQKCSLQFHIETFLDLSGGAPICCKGVELLDFPLWSPGVFHQCSKMLAHQKIPSHSHPLEGFDDGQCMVSCGRLGRGNPFPSIRFENLGPTL